MSLKYTAKEFIAAVESITVTSGDGTAGTLLCRLYNNQPERRAAATGYDYKTPALFFEFLFDEHDQLGSGGTGKAMRIRCLLEVSAYNSENELDQDFTILDLKEHIHRSLNGLKLPSCSPLIQVGETLDSNHDNVYLYAFEYSTYYTDFTGTPYDELNTLYTEQTLTNPQLVFGVNVHDEIKTNTPLYVADIIEVIKSASFSASGATLNCTLNDYDFYYSAGDEVAGFYVDWGDGNITAISKGVQVSNTYNTQGFKRVLIVGLFGGSLDVSINVSSSLVINEYPNTVTWGYAYDIPAGFEENFPIGISTSDTFTGGTFRLVSFINENDATTFGYFGAFASQYNALYYINFIDNLLNYYVEYRGNISLATHTISNKMFISLKTP